VTSGKRLFREREDYDPDDDEPIEGADGPIVLYESATGRRTVAGDVIPFLDVWFKELNAAQPLCPPSLWGAWTHYREVWGAVRVRA
jgi:hypothetical protein